MEKENHRLSNRSNGFLGGFMKNQAEIYQALLDGETLEYDKHLFKIVDGFLMDMSNKIESSFGLIALVHSEEAASLWQIYVELKWYDNIPEGGVLCWVSDGINRYVDIIIKYETESQTKYGFHSMESHWPNATPLTKQEIQVFIDNAPEAE